MPDQPARSEPDQPVDAELVETPLATTPDVETPPVDTPRTAVQPAVPEPIDAEIVDPADLTPTPPPIPTDYTDQGVPTLDYVRDKIEGRSATAMGWEELRTKEVEEAEKQYAEREEKGKDKLAEIRRQMGL